MRIKYRSEITYYDHYNFHVVEILDCYCQCKNNKTDGDYRSWYGSGQIYLYCIYKNGEQMEWYPSSLLESYCYYKDNKLIKKII